MRTRSLSGSARTEMFRLRAIVHAVFRTFEVASLEDCKRCDLFFERISSFARVHAVKVFRLSITLSETVPVLPCLDHEAMLHEEISPHASAYIEDIDGRGLHEVVCVPAERRIEVDIVSSAGEHSEESHRTLLSNLKYQFPDYVVTVNGPSWLRGDHRVARACRGQLSLRDVLMSRNFDRLRDSVEQLTTIGALMEKQSRVASWSVRTVTGPMLALGGFLSYQFLGLLTEEIGEVWVQWLRYFSVGGLGAVFLYLGLKAAHLTEMANRVWKRGAEYGFILRERQTKAVVSPKTM